MSRVDKLELAEIVKHNEENAKETCEGNPLQVLVLSNITTNPLNEILTYQLRYEGYCPEIKIGDYDAIVQNSENVENKTVVCIIWELANLVESIEQKLELGDAGEVVKFKQKFISEFHLVCSNLKNVKQVYLGTFNTVAFTNNLLYENKLESLCEELNEYISSNLPQNFHLIKTEKIIQRLGIKKSFDLRFFNQAKALYTKDFWCEYAIIISTLLYPAFARSKKVFVVDCDNTLWKGIIGEDLLAGISFPSSFLEVQFLLKNFSNKGIILAICSKNNPDDVDSVFESHNKMFLDKKDFTVIKANWDDKVSNLKDIAKELNVSLSSFVFMDDSEFEIELVRSSIPEVQTLLVPKRLHEYPGIVRELSNVFYSPALTNDDLQRKKYYETESRRAQSKVHHENMDAYLQSLNLSLTLNICADETDRISQLCRKTNQFNLTTVRYSEADINKMSESNEYLVCSIHVSDTFGDYGTVGVLIAKELENAMFIDTFLLSCRVLGRGIEHAVFETFSNFFMETYSLNTLELTYKATEKNKQVYDFLSRLPFSKKQLEEGNTHFSTDRERLHSMKLKHFAECNLNDRRMITWKTN